MSMTTSVVSAAILEGNLIIGLSDGSIINCGYVQGPPGLKGDPGPMGAVGSNGRDGNTILTSAGTPRNDSGVDGDYCIDNINWRIYGPKSGGVWGKGKSMLPDPENLITNGRGMSGGGGSMGGDSGGSGGGSGTVWTTSVQATGSGRLASKGTVRKDVYYSGSPNGIIEPAGPLATQANINGWIVEALEELEGVIPVAVTDTLPDEGQYEGDLILFEGSLYVWVKDEWVKVSASGGAHVGVTPPVDTEVEKGTLWFNNEETELTLYIFDGKDWVPAAPPVSLDGVTSSITNIETELLDIHNDVREVRGDIVLTNQDLVRLAKGIKDDQSRQDGQIATLEEEIEQLAPALERGAWTFVLNDTPEPGEYTIIRDKDQAGLDQCTANYEECMVTNSGDPIGQAQCNRDLDACKDKYKQAPDPDFSKAYALQFNKTDASGIEHTFPDVKKGTVIDIFNDADDSFCIAIARGEANVSTDYVLIFVDVSQSRGSANGLSRVKVFEAAEVETTNYVRKSGDTITGPLVLDPQKTSNPLTINALDTGDSRAVVVNVRGQTKDGKRPTIFSVVADGRVNIDDDVEITSKWQVPHKKYVDDLVKTLSLGSPYVFRTKNTTPSSLKDGEFTYDGDGHFYAARHDVNRNRIGVSKEDYFTTDGMFKVYRYNGNYSVICIMRRYKTCRTGQGGNNHMKWEQHDPVYSHTEWLEDGETYYLSDGFLLPH